MSRPVIALAAASFALILPSPALSASGSSNGVAVRTSGSGVIGEVAPYAGKRFAAVRGRRMTVRCTRFGTPGELTRTDDVEIASVEVPRRRAPIRVLMASRRYDLCELARAGAEPFATVALTARGRTRVDEERRARELIGLVIFATSLSPDARSWPTAARVLAMAERGVVALASPDASPPAGSLGYYSDGAQRAVVAVLSAAGRRLFIDIAGDVTSTNVLEYLNP